MATFKYTARTRAGEKIEGVLDAQDRRAALTHIERLGQVPMSVEEKHAAAPPPAAGLDWRHWFRRRDQRPRMASRDVLLFSTELSDLLASGMKLGNALNTLCHRPSNPDTDAVMKALRDDIIQGRSLSDALAQFPETFPPLYVSLARAGEAGGNLAEVMTRIVTHYERAQEVKEKIIMALVYPGIVLTAGLITLVFSMMFVVPRFSTIFAALDATLPLPTRILIGVSTGLVKFGWLILAAGIIGAILFQRYLRTEAGRHWWHTLHLKVPLIRGIVTAGAFTQFARTLGMLLSNGVPVLDALALMEKTVQNTVIAAEIRKARDRVTDGMTISGPLAAGRVFPRMLTDMLAIGEETGDMAAALGHIARRYENQLDRSVKIFTTALEPILIVLMALLVGFVAISILLAVFDLTSGMHV